VIVQIFVTILHVFLCIGLMLIILLQPGKSDIASAFGGGAGNQMYGPRSQGHFLGRATTVIALLFMVTSITLAVYSSARIRSSGTGIEDAIQRIQDQDAKKATEQAPTDATGGSLPPIEQPAQTAPAVPAETAPAQAAPAGAPEQVAPPATTTPPAGPPPEPTGTQGTTPYAPK
jgi:preprotein translocase subunit SecG